MELMVQKRNTKTTHNKLITIWNNIMSCRIAADVNANKTATSKKTDASVTLDIWIVSKNQLQGFRVMEKTGRAH